MAAHLTLVKTVADPESQAAARLTAFVTALTALSERYGIAIADGAELYEMEPDDRLSAYHADTESRLTRG